MTVLGAGSRAPVEVTYVVDVLPMMGGALGLAVLTNLADARTAGLKAAGVSPAATTPQSTDGPESRRSDSRRHIRPSCPHLGGM
jgi:hypothetical protein